MLTIDVFVDDLIADYSVTFGDSDGVVSEAYDSGSLDRDKWLDLSDCPSDPETKMFTLDWKLQECSDRFLNSIERDGIRNPVAMMDGTIMDGHHRMAAGYVLGMKIPVVVYDSWEEFDNNHQWEKAGTVHSDGELLKETF